ncbi:MAG: hypothetical protein LCH61_01030 [Proteobacteria bacterium]|nr:hypothetical protein [Pseudomonadota bacterium]
MGEYAEMMLDGTCCEGCGEYLGDGDGFPRYCSAACAAGRGAITYLPVVDRKPIPKTKCPECGKKVKRAGLRDHLRDMHGSKTGQSK